MAAFDAHPELQDYDPALDARMDELVARYGGRLTYSKCGKDQACSAVIRKSLVGRHARC